MGLFGWFNKTRRPVNVTTPVSPQTDGSFSYNGGSLSGYYGFNFDIDSSISDEIDMISRYRNTASFPECDLAVEQITNEAVIMEGNEPPVSLNLDNLPKVYKSIAKKIEEEWENVQKFYKFNENCHDIFKRWYIDGRLYYYMTIDKDNPKRGIVDIRFIDPKKIKKVTEITKEKKDGVDVVKSTETYYLFNDDGLKNADKGLKLSPDIIVDVPSGLIDAETGKVVSYLLKAIKPVNQLKMMEDALVIYRITRAPERRLFYVDVGNLPAQKAEQYVQNIMQKFRNKVQYDAKTGEIKNGRNYLSMVEDFWLPRREGGRSTEVQTLQGGQNLSEIADIEYFQRKLYQSLGVPKQRLLPENNFQLGRTQEISREEIIFSKMIQRLRNKFNLLFKIPLKTQLISKNIIKESDWEEISNSIMFVYNKDNYFDEIKEQEVLNDRLQALSQVDAYKGTYFSIEWIMKNVLKMNDDEWNKIKKQIKSEKEEHPEWFGLEVGEDNFDFRNNTNNTNDSNYSNDDETPNSNSDDKNDVNSDNSSDDEEEEEKNINSRKLLDSTDRRKPRGYRGRFNRKLMEN